ncbi:serine/threonine protein kinase, CMGC, dual-specificity [Saitoella coloradoensis]
MSSPRKQTLTRTVSPTDRASRRKSAYMLDQGFDVPPVPALPKGMERVMQPTKASLARSRASVISPTVGRTSSNEGRLGSGMSGGSGAGIKTAPLGYHRTAASTPVRGSLQLGSEGTTSTKPGVNATPRQPPPPTSTSRTRTRIPSASYASTGSVATALRETKPDGLGRRESPRTPTTALPTRSSRHVSATVQPVRSGNMLLPSTPPTPFQRPLTQARPTPFARPPTSSTTTSSTTARAAASAAAAAAATNESSANGSSQQQRSKPALEPLVLPPYYLKNPGSAMGGRIKVGESPIKSANPRKVSGAISRPPSSGAPLAMSTPRKVSDGTGIVVDKERKLKTPLTASRYTFFGGGGKREEESPVTPTATSKHVSMLPSKSLNKSISMADGLHSVHPTSSAHAPGEKIRGHRKEKSMSFAQAGYEVKGFFKSLSRSGSRKEKERKSVLGGPVPPLPSAPPPTSYGETTGQQRRRKLSFGGFGFGKGGDNAMGPPPLPGSSPGKVERAVVEVKELNIAAVDAEMRNLQTGKKHLADSAEREKEALVEELWQRSTRGKELTERELRDADLTLYEVGEIRDYNPVWFTGVPGTKKRQGDIARGEAGAGYDDERGDYLPVMGDHLAYRYQCVDMLGKGSFGSVIRCLDWKTGQWVAIKIIRNKKRFHAQAVIEVDILRRLMDWDPDDVARVVRVEDDFYFRGHLCIVTGLLGMNLYEFVKGNGFIGCSLEMIRRFTIQLLESLVLLYRHKVIHCDLKPENVLLAHSLSSEIRTIDFGSSCFENEKVYTYIQSRFYRSPEVILGMNYGMPIDMWSLGCILAELYTGFPIFPGEDEKEQLACIMEIFGPPERHLIEKSDRRRIFFESNLKPKLHKSSKGKIRRPSTKTLAQALKFTGADDSFLDFITKCLKWSPDARMTPMEALQHDFVTGVVRSKSPTKARPRVMSTNVASPLAAPSGRPLPDLPKWNAPPKISPSTFGSGQSGTTSLSTNIGTPVRSSPVKGNTLGGSHGYTLRSRIPATTQAGNGIASAAARTVTVGIDTTPVSLSDPLVSGFRLTFSTAKEVSSRD